MLNLNCVICAELFGQADDVHATICGHMFHFTCLMQWLERSKTCPQCRNKCTQRNIFRVYFNLANLDTSRVDIGSLQEQLDSTKLQLKLKEIEVHKAETQIQGLKESQKKCMKTIKALESKLEKKDFCISSYVEQVNLLKTEAKLTEDLRKEVKALRHQLQTVEGVTTILTASNAEADRLLKTENDPQKLSVWVSTLKRELRNCEAKKTDLRNVLRVVQHDLRLELQSKKKLEEQIVQLESEYYQLTEKLKAEVKPETKTSEVELNNTLLKMLKEENKRLTISPTIKENVRKIEESDSPYLNIKSSSVGFMPYAFKRNHDVVSTNKDNVATATTTKLATLKISPIKVVSVNSGAIRKTTSDLTEKYSIFKKPRLGFCSTASGSTGLKPATNLVFNGFGGSEKIDPFASNADDDKILNAVDKTTVTDSQQSSKISSRNFKRHTSTGSTNLSDRLKSGGLRSFMVSKPQKN